jgi:hypothetical protein
MKNLKKMLKLLSPVMQKELKGQLNALAGQSFHETEENCASEVYRLAQLKCMEDYVNAHIEFINAHIEFIKEQEKAGI